MENEEKELMQRLGGVLTYRCGGRKTGIGGQTVGADGFGEFAVLINGTPEEARLFATKYLRELEAHYHIESTIFVENGDDYGYFGNPTRMVTSNEPN